MKADTAADLVDAVADVVRHSIPCYEGRNLLLNWTSMKSELLVTMPSTELCTFHATLATQAAQRGWPHPSLSIDGTMIRVVRMYNYLGRQVSDTGNTTQHAKTRTALAAASVRQFAHVYRSRRVQLRHKVELCNSMYTLSQMMHGYSTPKELDKRSTKIYATSYLLSWKACLGRGNMEAGQFAHLTEAQILYKVSKPSWQVWSDITRLRLVQRVVRADCPVFRAAMAAIGCVGDSWWLAFALAANRLRDAVDEVKRLPCFTEATRGEWMQFVALNKGKWKNWLRQYRDGDVIRIQELIQMGQGAQDHLPPPIIPEDWYKCNECDKSCGTYRGLLSHRRQAHRTESALAERVGSNVCFACHGEYSSRVAHLAHLSANLRCALATMVYCRRLTAEELQAAKQ
eukprot:6014985-Amphidinium_carterae.1